MSCEKTSTLFCCPLHFQYTIKWLVWHQNVIPGMKGIRPITSHNHLTMMLPRKTRQIYNTGSEDSEITHLTVCFEKLFTCMGFKIF